MGDGHDLIGHVRACGFFMAGECEFFLLLAGNAVFFGERLGSLAHRVVGLRIGRIQPRVRRGVETAHRDARHGFDTGADKRLARAECDFACRAVNRLHRRAAPAVKRRARDGDRQPRQEHAHARDVEALFTFGEGAADEQIFNRLGRNFGFGDQGFYDLGQDIVGPDARQLALAGKRERRAQKSGKYDACHNDSPA
jgi:hypothetical protein